MQGRNRHRATIRQLIRKYATILRHVLHDFRVFAAEMAVKYRTAWIVIALEIVVLAMLERHDRDVDTLSYYTKPGTFLLLGILSVMIIVTMVVQEPRYKNSRWWKHIDPWLLVLMLYFFSIAVYAFGIYGAYDRTFTLPATAYDKVRDLLFFTGFFGIPVVSLVLEYRFRARVKNITKSETIYKMDEEEQEQSRHPTTEP